MSLEQRVKRAREAESHAIEFVVALAVGALLLVTALYSGWPVNHDSAAYLQIGQMLLGGAVPYVDYVELNPPLIQYLHALPAALSEGSGLSLPQSFGLLVGALCLYSATALYTSLAHTGQLDPAQRSVVAAGWLCLSAAVLLNNGFGQREHLFVLAYAPWLTLRFARHRGAKLSAWRAGGIGVLAAPFALLKPQLLLILCAGEIWLLYRSKKLRALLAPEALAVAAIGVLYGAHFLLIPQAMREQFFGRWVPMIAANYDSYDTDAVEILRSEVGISVVMAVLVSLLVAAILRRRNQLGPLVEVVCLAVLTGAFAFFVQQKGWYYHAYPCLGAAGLLMLFAIATKTRELGGKARDLTRASLLAIGALAAFSSYCAFALAPRVQVGARALAVLISGETDPGDRVAFIDTSVAPSGTALLYADRLPALRFMPTFPIAFFSRARAEAAQAGAAFAYPIAAEWTKEERRVLEEIASDLRRYTPPLVLIRDVDCLACPPGFSIDEYLRRSGWTSRHLSGYDEVASAGGYSVYKRDRMP